MKNVIQFKPKTHIDDNGRVCTKCQQYKHWDNFYSKNKGAYNKDSKCIPCAKEYDKVYNKTYQRKKKEQQPIANQLQISSTGKFVGTLKTQFESSFNMKTINACLSQRGNRQQKKMLHDLLVNIMGSNTGYNIKEEIVANVLNLLHCTDVNGPDAYSDDGQPFEIKTNFISSDKGNKFNAGGSFNDLTAHKLAEIPSYTMAVGLFVDHYLLGVVTFPGSHKTFIDKITKDFNSKKSKRVCGQFSYNHWLDCPDVSWEVLPDPSVMLQYANRLPKKLYDAVIAAQSNAIRSGKASKTSEDASVNLKDLIERADDI